VWGNPPVCASVSIDCCCRRRHHHHHHSHNSNNSHRLLQILPRWSCSTPIRDSPSTVFQARVLQLTIVRKPSLLPPHRNDNGEDDGRPVVVQSHYFGSVSSQSDPGLYLQADLDGWIKGLGFQILSRLLQETLRPRHVIQMTGDSRSKAVDLSGAVMPCNRTRPLLQLHRCWAYNSVQRRQQKTTTRNDNRNDRHQQRKGE